MEKVRAGAARPDNTVDDKCAEETRVGEEGTVSRTYDKHLAEQIRFAWCEAGAQCV